MAENTELGILENLKKGMVDNTDHEGEVLENLKKVNESTYSVMSRLSSTCQRINVTADILMPV